MLIPMNSARRCEAAQVFYNFMKYLEKFVAVCGEKYGNDDRITLVSRFDNLGKGASGAAIQNMNIVLGVDETEGLRL